MPKGTVLDVFGRPLNPASQVERIDQLKRAYARRLFRRKCTTLELHAIARAATLTALAEFAANDPNCSVDAVCKLDTVASRARASLAKMAGETRRERSVPSIGELMQRMRTRERNPHGQAAS
jgi:hypothetical protein